MFGLDEARKLARVRAGDRLVLAEASVGLLAAKAFVRLLPFDVWTRVIRLSRMPEESAAGSVPWQTVRRVVWAVDLTARHLPGEINCLPRALATRALLRRRRVPNILHVGVMRTDDGELKSHAWVECRGQVVIGSLPELAQYVPMVRFGEEVGEQDTAPFADEGADAARRRA